MNRFSEATLQQSHTGSCIMVLWTRLVLVGKEFREARQRKWKKIWFCIPYKTHSGSNIHGSISFMIDNMHYVILRIWEQDSVPWCGEIQNKILEVLGNTFNLHSNSTLRPRSVVSQSVSKGELSSGFTRIYTPLHNNDSLKINFCMFLPFITNWLSNWAGLLGLSNWALMCGLEWD